MEFRRRLAKIGAIVFSLAGLLIVVGVSLPGTGMPNRETIYVLAVLISAGAILIYYIPWERFDPRLFMLVSFGGIAALAALVFLAGGHMSQFFPIFFMVAVFASAYYTLPTLFIVTSAIVLVHVSDLFIARPSDPQFTMGLIAFVPSLYIVTFISYYIVREVTAQTEAKEDVQELANQLKKKAEQMEVLFEVAKRAGASLKLDQVLNTIAEEACRFFGSDVSVIRLYNERTQELWVAATRGLSDEVARKLPVLKVGQGVAGWVAEHGEPLNVPDVSKEPRFVFPLDQANVKSALAVPMMLGNKVVGALSCATFGKREFTEDDVMFVSTLAGEAAIVIENARLYEATEAMTLEDALTGLYNQRRLQAALDDELRRSERYKREFSFVMLDIDYFKHYNDANGHLKGDIVLETIAKILLQNTRDVDSVYRYGGEEISIVLPETSKDTAFELAERLRRAIQEHAFDGEKKQPNKDLTVSIGVATYPGDAVSKEGIINKADQAMYQAKKAGRNRVVMA